MLPQKNRIKTEEFLNIVNYGKRILSDHFSLVYAKNNLHFKASVVVSKKISKKAPIRNYEKRVIRAVISKIFKPYDNFKFSCLFFIKKSVSGSKFEDLAEEIRELSKKIN